MEHNCNIEYVNNWKTEILVEDDQFQKAFSSAISEFDAISVNLIEFVFNICTQLNLSPEIQFSSIDTFDFYIAKIYHLIKNNANKQITNENLLDEIWLNSVFSFTDQIFLRILSLISLVAKYHQNSINVGKKIDNFIKTVLLGYEETTLMKMEMQTLKIINYQIRKPQVLDIIHLFIFTSVQPHCAATKKVEEITTGVLRIVYIQRNLIYEKFLTLVHSKDRNNEIKKDKTLLAAAVLLASVILLNYRNDIRKAILRSISDESRNSEYDIEVFANIIYHKSV